MEAKARVKAGILGLGLIGSSIFKAFLNSDNSDCYELFVYSKSSYKAAREFCKNEPKVNISAQISDNISDDINILKDCDIVFVCSSISKTLFYLDKLNEILSKNTLVLDVSSIKKPILEGKKDYNFKFVLSHPMAGSTKTGFLAGDSNLFKGAKWLYDKDFKEINILDKIITDFGAVLTPVDMKNHDEMMCQISHFPAILSVLLFESVSENALKAASSGFRDTTRLALTNSDMLINMFNFNLENIEKMYKRLGEKLEDLKAMPENEKIDLFNKIAKKRKEMYDNEGKNVF